MKISCWIFN